MGFELLSFVLTLISSSGGGVAVHNSPYQTYTFDVWSGAIANGTCSHDSTPLPIKLEAKDGSTAGYLTCATTTAGEKVFQFPAGIFEIGVQWLVPESHVIVGSNGGPNDMSNPTKSPDWSTQTLFLATRGATEYYVDYCGADDMYNTRVGFVLSSNVTVKDVSYQGIDTVRPMDNGALCGGGVFETKGCGDNDCKRRGVNNGGSDGIGSHNVILTNVRLNDYYFSEDKAKVGANIPGNYDCKTGDWKSECCFCKPNGIRSSQVGVWIPQTRDAAGTSKVLISDVVSSSSQADGINLHGYVTNAVVENAYVQNTGDDGLVLWGSNLSPENVTFKDCTAVNTGVLRPNWYGNCVATYGLKSIMFENITCKVPTLTNPIPQPGTNPNSMGRIDSTMYIIFTSFGGTYPKGNSITIKGWRFEDLDGNAYTAANGTLHPPDNNKMAWTKADADKGALVTPYYLPGKTQQVNIYVSEH